MANVFDLIGRILISALFLISAYNKIFNLDGSMSWMESFGVPGFLIFPGIAIETILPVFIIVGYQARIAAGILAIFCLTTAFLFHFDFSNQSQLISLSSRRFQANPLGRSSNFQSSEPGWRITGDPRFPLYWVSCVSRDDLLAHHLVS